MDDSNNKETKIKENKMNKILSSHEKPLGLYIHIPFCEKKCSYCDFYSIHKNNKIIEKYVQALKKEIILYAEHLQNKKINTVYFGGGTPSLLKPQMIDELLKIIRKKFKLLNKTEISLEANPSSMNQEKIYEYNKSGVNRLSLGVQSFCNKELDMLGRLHNFSQAREIIKKVRNTFSNYNIDLIFALPGQTLDQWKNNLQNALEFDPPHLSIYNLQIEKDTQLYKMVKNNNLTPVDDKLDAEMYKITRQILQQAGYNQYEISNFARDSFESRHNLLYWKFKPYLGLGPSAHGFCGDKRYYNINNVSEYITQLNKNKYPVKKIIELTERDLMAEKMFMGLRLNRGVSKKIFYKRFSVRLKDVYDKEIKDLKRHDLITEDEDKIRLTEKGLFLGNRVFMKFL